MVQRRAIALIFAISQLLLAGMARADDDGSAQQSAPVDPSGSWKWEYTFNDNTAEFHLKLDWDGKELTGTYTAFDNSSDIEDAKFEDNKLSFISKREFNGNEFTVHFDGEAKPEEIVGTVAVDFGQGPREFDWNAKRVVDLDDVLGTWKLHLETPNGVVEPEITITQEGDELHGAYVSPFGEREAKNLKLNDGELTWEISSDESDEFDFQVIYRGKPRGNSIAGTNEFNFGGNTGTMEFSGERTPPADEKGGAGENAAAPKMGDEAQPAEKGAVGSDAPAETPAEPPSASE